ncbi:MAG: hypothetical protein COW30_04575 [Rhodospirillales bacterium CG15_BIG_FIL_POST_REV_8_21_14_020_66_15]|nr:MAG: hypothetical protein COW30_04575 [Rhodospirillales bacterium CG15_BIG_FIL_POST_REV_8_21_14_020_66_15]
MAGTRVCQAALAAASVLYLGTEVIFNMSLLEAVASPALDPRTFHAVEAFGRRASSTGFTLAVIGLFVSTAFIVRGKAKWAAFVAAIAVCTMPFLVTPFHRETLLAVGLGALLVAAASRAPAVRPHWRSAASVIGLTIMAWPAFYNGKIAVTEHFIVERSSGTGRLAARHITLLRRALVSDAVQLHDVALADFGGTERPEAKAFLVMLGPLALNADSLLSWAERQDNVAKVADAIVHSENAVDIKARYRDYLGKRAAFERDVYAPYAEASKQYIERAGRIETQARDAWVRLQQDVDAAWDRYRQANDAFFEKFNAVARDGVAQRLADFVDRRSRCGTNSCTAWLDRRYQKEMSRVANPAPPWTYFCDKKDRGPLGVLGDVLKGGTLMEIIARQSRTYYSCDTRWRTVGARLALWKRDEFMQNIKNTAKLPPGLNEAAYRAHSNLSAHVAGALATKHSLVLPGGWSLSDQKAFYRAFLAAADREAREKWRADTKERFGQDVPSGLSMDRLTLTPPLQKRLRAELGGGYVDGFMFSWSERQYAEKVIRPAIERRVRQEIEGFKTDAVRYENGGDLESIGKQAFRAAIIPPIAVALSLFFSLLSAVKVGGMVLAPLTGAIFRFAVPSRTRAAAVSVITVSAISLLPLVLSNRYAESQAWKILATEAREAAPLLTGMAEYVIRVQPVLAVAGAPLMKALDPYGLRPHAP